MIMVSFKKGSFSASSKVVMVEEGPAVKKKKWLDLFQWNITEDILCWPDSYKKLLHMSLKLVHAMIFLYYLLYSTQDYC